MRASTWCNSRHSDHLMKFNKIAQSTSKAIGTPAAFAVALGSVILWGVTGPFLGYSSAWQTVANTGTALVTYLMLFLVQNSQNSDLIALQKKLDELIRANDRARNDLIGAEKQDLPADKE